MSINGTKSRVKPRVADEAPLAAGVEAWLTLYCPRKLMCLCPSGESLAMSAVATSDPRWRNGSIYVFGLDTCGNTLFSGDSYSQWWGSLAPELNDYLDGPFGGRDVFTS